ncbi:MULTISPECIES: hypothetical protein [Actinoplanes]|uniref:hypothetical protein n=1 Tax=Actinoplanes TaxID=1865 RepID=UPI000A4C0B2E|nr:MULTISPECIES: hypothetical protein [Actinoplanes]
MSGWTDDLTIPLPPGRTPADVVDLIARLATHPDAFDDVVRALTAEFGLAEDDAEFAFERYGGGLVRASSRIPQNCPPADKDPIAWEAFQRGFADPQLIAALYPQFASRPEQ